MRFGNDGFLPLQTKIGKDPSDPFELRRPCKGTERMRSLRTVSRTLRTTSWLRPVMSTLISPHRIKGRRHHVGRADEGFAAIDQHQLSVEHPGIPENLEVCVVAFVHQRRGCNDVRAVVHAAAHRGG